jgi:hypothetical protein
VVERQAQIHWGGPRPHYVIVLLSILEVH